MITYKKFIYSKLGVCIAGVAALGIAVGFIFVPLLSEIIAAVQEKEGMGENPLLNDKASGIFNTAYASGCIVAPILGGALEDMCGFRKTCDVLAFASLSFAVLYFFLNILPGFFERKRPAPSRLSGSILGDVNNMKSSEVDDVYHNINNSNADDITQSLVKGYSH